jgi:UDP-N-acetylglucosamine 2-epimerase (non-hydrolysing)
MLRRFKYWKELEKQPNLILTKPLGYIDFLSLMMESKFVITDSGGIQEETTYLGIPCFTLRKNTERPVTITQGTNTITGEDYARLLRLIRRIPFKKKFKRPKFWDGKTALRITKILLANVRPVQ